MAELGMAADVSPDSVPGRMMHQLTNPKTATFIPASAPPNAREQLQRLRSLAWLLDESIALPGGIRIGLDAIIGLIPGVGDVLGAFISTFILNEARRLGAPRSVLLRMSGNVLIETVIGAVPFLGDLFDAGFKANVRNLRLLERYQLDPVGSRRSSRWFTLGFSVMLLALLTLMIGLPLVLIVTLFKAL